MEKAPFDLKLTFLGGAGCVTGSKILLESNGSRIMIDCGLFQGIKSLRNRNWQPLEIDASTIEAVILTHAHLDHSGYLPLLVKNGFSGKIYCTKPTQNLTEIILLDCGKIQEEEAERANRHGYTRHKPAKPLYTVEEARIAIQLLNSHELKEWIIINEDFKFNFKNSGHILGSAMVEVKVQNKKFLFSGDMGRKKPLILPPPEKIPHTDFLVIESTYGDRVHRRTSSFQQLEAIVNKTYKKGGVLLIPTFTVERAQEIIYLLHQLLQEKKIPKQPIYLDSPMGVDASVVFVRHDEWCTLSEKQVISMMRTVELVKNAEVSRAIVNDDAQKIVLAGSGMIEGGRILHYLNKYLGDVNSTVLLVGYQAEGTRGRALREGASEIKFFGHYHKVKAEVEEISSLSAHSDYLDTLDWLNNFKEPPQKVFINHGEPHQADALRTKIQHYFGWDVIVADINCPYLLRF